MKKTKKVLSVLLIIAFAAAVILTGCGGNTGKTDKVTTVGFIYIGSKTDGGYSQAQHNGTMAVEKHFGNKIKTIVAENVAEDKQAVRSTAVNMIDQGATVVIGTSFGFMDALDELAKEYPNVTFLHFSGYKMNDKNFGNYFGAMEEPRYLSGMIAGLMTKSNKLGYVAAYPYTEVKIGINAFALGAQSVNPNATVSVVYINSWNDPANEKAAAESLLAQGCDVITQHCDSAGPQLAAQDKKAFAIGYNLDNSKVAPNAFLTAPVWHHEKYLIPTIQKIMDGKYVPESYYGTMKDGYIGLAPMTNLVPADVKKKVEEVQKKMVDGTFHVFVGPIKDNQGNIVVKEGETLDRAGIWKMEYLVQGVTGRDN